ncbi:hypothetical protein ACWJJH_03355 [Endozoicomonadaceae bacterium StTr2]
MKIFVCFLIFSRWAIIAVASRCSDCSQYPCVCEAAKILEGGPKRKGRVSSKSAKGDKHYSFEDYDRLFTEQFGDQLTTWQYSGPFSEVYPLDSVEAGHQPAVRGYVYFVLQVQLSNPHHAGCYAAADAWQFCKGMLNGPDRLVGSEDFTTQVQFRFRILCLLLDRPESAFAMIDGLSERVLVKLWRGRQTVLPDIQRLTSTSLVRTLQQAVAGIILLRKKNKAVKCEQIFELLDAEVKNHNPLTATALMLNFVRQVALLSIKTEFQTTSDDVSQLLDLADHGYIPALLYAIKKINVVLHHSHQKHPSWSQPGTINALKYRMKRQLEIGCERFRIIYPERLPELKALVLLLDPAKTDLQACPSGGDPLVTELFNDGHSGPFPRPEEIEALKAKLQYYGYHISLNREEIPPSTANSHSTGQAGGDTAAIASADSGTASAEVGLAPDEITDNIKQLAEREGNDDRISDLLEELTTCYSPTVPAPRTPFNYVSFELSPCGLTEHGLAEVNNSWKKISGAGPGEQSYDSPLLRYPGLYPNIPAKLVKLHLNVTKHVRHEDIRWYYILLAVLFEKPSWEYYYPVFFSSPEYGHWDTPLTNEPGRDFFKLSLPDGGQPLQTALCDFVMLAVNSRFDAHGRELDLRLKNIKDLQPAGAPVHLFCLFLKAVCETSRRYHSVIYKTQRPHHIIKPLIEVAEEGYLPAIDLIDSMLDEKTGILPVSKMPPAEQELQKGDLMLVRVMRTLYQFEQYVPCKGAAVCAIPTAKYPGGVLIESKGPGSENSSSGLKRIPEHLMTLEALMRILPDDGGLKPKTQVSLHTRTLEKSAAIAKRTLYQGALLEFCNPDRGMLVPVMHDNFIRSPEIKGDGHLLAYALFLLYFSEPDLAVYRKLFFVPDAGPRTCPEPEMLQSKLCMIIDDPTLAKSLCFSLHQILIGHNTGYDNFRTLDPHIWCFREHRDSAESASCYLFFSFLQSVMEAANLWRAQANPEPEAVLEPLIKVAEQGYFPAVKLIEQMLDKRAGMFDPGRQLQQQQARIGIRLESFKRPEPQGSGGLFTETASKKKGKRGKNGQQIELQESDRKKLSQILKSDNKGNNLAAADKSWLRDHQVMIRKVASPEEQWHVTWLVHDYQGGDAQLKSLKHYLVTHLNEGNLKKAKEILQLIRSNTETLDELRHHIHDDPDLGASVVLLATQYEANQTYRDCRQLLAQLIDPDQWEQVLIDACIKQQKRLKFNPKSGIAPWLQRISCFLVRQVLASDGCVFPGREVKVGIVVLLADDQPRREDFDKWLKYCSETVIPGISKATREALKRFSSAVVDGNDSPHQQDFAAHTRVSKAQPQSGSDRDRGRGKRKKKRCSALPPSDLKPVAPDSPVSIPAPSPVAGLTASGQINPVIPADKKAATLEQMQRLLDSVQCIICLEPFGRNGYEAKPMPCCGKDVCAACLKQQAGHENVSGRCSNCKAEINLRPEDIDKITPNLGLMSIVDLLVEMGQISANRTETDK